MPVWVFSFAATKVRVAVVRARSGVARVSAACAWCGRGSDRLKAVVESQAHHSLTRSACGCVYLTSKAEQGASAG